VGTAARLACHNHAVSITEIAGYRVIRQLGAGGMGQVFLVQHPRLPRQDALKLLDAGVSRNDEFKARFQREADLLAQLSHSNIVTLHDRGEFEGRLWITMEYVDGTDAAELLKDGGPLDANLALLPEHTVRTIPLAELREQLPADTRTVSPDERAAGIAIRQRHVQRRYRQY